MPSVSFAVRLDQFSSGPAGFGGVLKQMGSVPLFAVQVGPGFAIPAVMSTLSVADGQPTRLVAKAGAVRLMFAAAVMVGHCQQLTKAVQSGAYTVGFTSGGMTLDHGRSNAAT